VSEPLFTEDDGAFVPGPHTRGPWDPAALHGGAVAALLTDAFERHAAVLELSCARLTFDFVRPVPMAPLSLSLDVPRPGRRVVELAAVVASDGETVCRADALFLAAVPSGLPSAQAPLPAPLEGPTAGRRVEFALDESAGPSAPSFPAAMEMSWLDDPAQLGPARVWMRPRRDLLPGRALSPLARVPATADFANGVAAPLPFADYLFINADLALHFLRVPRGEWIGVDAGSHAVDGGTALTASVLHDVEGPVAWSYQALVVGPR